MKISKLVPSILIMAGLMVACTESKNNEETVPTTVNTTDAVIENIMTRTSIRQFTSQPIGKDTLVSIVKAGMAAPSAVNLQPWSFIVIDEPEALNKLNEVHPYANLKTATAAIIVCGLLDKTDNEGIKPYWVQDCSAASENILLAAHAYGIGAVWCGVYPNSERIEAVKGVLDIPEEVMPLNIITMGFPAENPQPKDKFKTENIHYQKW